MKTMTFRGVCLALLLCLAVCCAAGAENTPVIRDDADLLTDAEEADLLAVMTPLCEYGTPMFWSTTQSGSDYELAATFYERQLGRGDGTLFVINMGTRVLTIYSDGAVKRVVTSAESDTITDNVYRYASRGDYYGCASSVYGQIGRLLRGERIARPMKIVSNALLAVTLSLFLVYLYISQRYEQRSGASKAAVPVSVLSAAGFSAAILGTEATMTKQTKTKISSGSSGGGGFRGGGGGGFSGGGGHSGSSGSHRF